MSLNALEKPNKVIMHELDRLFTENTKKFVYSKLIFIKNIIKSESN
jgi:hypothetical protein